MSSAARRYDPGQKKVVGVATRRNITGGRYRGHDPYERVSEIRLARLFQRVKGASGEVFSAPGGTINKLRQDEHQGVGINPL